jgi:hypothetical protein
MLDKTHGTRPNKPAVLLRTQNVADVPNRMISGLRTGARALRPVLSTARLATRRIGFSILCEPPPQLAGGDHAPGSALPVAPLFQNSIGAAIWYLTVLPHHRIPQLTQCHNSDPPAFRVRHVDCNNVFHKSTIQKRRLQPAKLGPTQNSRSMLEEESFPMRVAIGKHAFTAHPSTGWKKTQRGKLLRGPIQKASRANRC